MKYNKTNPYLASIKERHTLNKPGSNKCTQHLVLEIKDPELRYTIGDSVAIFPKHEEDLVEKTLSALGLHGEETVQLREGESVSIRHAFRERLNITHPTKKIVIAILSKLNSNEKKNRLEYILEEANKEALKEKLARTELWTLLNEFPEAMFEPQEICSLLQPLLPRFYSIASSPNVEQCSIHLTVALVRYEQENILRHGVCSHYLSNLAKLDHPEVPIYIQPADGFTLPADQSAPIIMVGPGTGIAPFRAFMQERVAAGASGKNWLFFGDWNRQYDFLYENYWQELSEKGLLRLSTAFSRDSDKKVYVQHLMHEQAKEVFSWLEEGAYFYVCGDASRMAKDVETVLLQIISKEAAVEEKAARDYLKRLRTDKRYLRDVY